MNGQQMDNVHSEVGPSSIADIILCPGRVKMQRGLPDKTSFAAAQGTVAHAIGERKLKGTRYPRKGTVIPEAGHEIEVDDELIDAVNVYVEHVNAIRGDSINRYATEGIEVSGDLAWMGLPEVFGTADYVHNSPFEVLTVRDYKHGSGVVVDVEENPQLMTYALIAGQEALNTFAHINLGIVQPRAGEPKIKIWETTPAKLVSWAEEVLIPTVHLALSEHPPLSPGEPQCRWCRAKGICPVFANHALQIAQEDFADYADIQPDKIVEAVPIEKVVQVYEQLPTLKTFIKAVEGRVFSELESGNHVPGYKLVHGRKSRSWVNEDAVVALLRSRNIEPYEYKILSPAKAEKALGKRKKEVAELIQTTLGAPVIAAADDRREAITTAQHDFEAI